MFPVSEEELFLMVFGIKNKAFLGGITQFCRARHLNSTSTVLRGLYCHLNPAQSEEPFIHRQVLNYGTFHDPISRYRQNPQ